MNYFGEILIFLQLYKYFFIKITHELKILIFQFPRQLIYIQKIIHLHILKNSKYSKEVTLK